MDLRVIKTKQSIKKAFLELRKKKSIEKITVRELSEIAMINKATFYLHYSDIYELADEVENNTIQEIFDELTSLDCIFTEPSKLTKEIVTAFYRRHDVISILFSRAINFEYIAGLILKPASANASYASLAAFTAAGI